MGQRKGAEMLCSQENDKCLLKLHVFLEDKATKHSYNGNAINTQWEGIQEVLSDQNRDGTEFAEIVLNIS